MSDNTMFCVSVNDTLSHETPSKEKALKSGQTLANIHDTPVSVYQFQGEDKQLVLIIDPARHEPYSNEGLFWEFTELHAFTDLVLKSLKSIDADTTSAEYVLVLMMSKLEDGISVYDDLAEQDNEKFTADLKAKSEGNNENQ